jgi:flagellar protein FliJ
LPSSCELDNEIAREERKSGMSDPAHFAYPTYAKAARSRRDNLLNSAAELRDQLEDARAELELAFEDLKKVEILDDRSKAQERVEAAHREQVSLDAIAGRISYARA